MYSDVFCKVYNEFGWNYYPEIFGEQLLEMLKEKNIEVNDSIDLACGTGVLCELMLKNGINPWGMDFSEGMIGIAKERNGQIHYEVADMITYRPNKEFDLVTCTGDAVNHIENIDDVKKIFQNVYAYTKKDGYFVFDLLNENEISDSEPFEMDFTDTMRVWFQMTRPKEDKVNLRIRIFEDNVLTLEENIRETVHDRMEICRILRECGFEEVICSDRLTENTENHSTTWFIIARK